MSLAICLMIKDERPYLAEWLAFHALVGVSHFRIYDNGSTDGSLALLARLATHYDIEVLPWTVTGIERQQSAFNDACQALVGRYDWVAFLDADEFLFDPQWRSLPNWLDGLEDDVGAVAVNQRVFGSAGRIEIDDEDLVIRRFTKRAKLDYPEHFWVKTIARPECVATFQFSHTAHLRDGRYIMTDGSQRQVAGNHPAQAAIVAVHGPVLHHYILKSWNEYQRKRQRGAVSDSGDMKRLTQDYFTGRDTMVNAEEDTALAAMAALVEARMRFAEAATAPGAPGEAVTPTDEVLIPDALPALEGFHPRDSANLFWIRDGDAATGNGAGTLVVTAAVPQARLGLGIYMIMDPYPLERMALRVNGAAVAFSLRALGERWRILLSEPMALQRGRNEITLEPPEFHRIRDVVPNTQDARRMSIALTEVKLITWEEE